MDSSANGSTVSKYILKLLPFSAQVPKVWVAHSIVDTEQKPSHDVNDPLNTPATAG